MSVRSCYDNVVQDTSGNALQYVEVNVYQVGTTTPVTLYSTRTGGGTLSNPITTGASGLVNFFVPPGDYDIKHHDTLVPARFSDRTFTINMVSGDTSTGGVSLAQLEAAIVALFGAPVGAIMAYGGSSTPASWLLCDGATLDRTTYAALFAAIGTAHGAPSGSTFQVPDLRGRGPIGLDSTALRIPGGLALGATGGEANHVLTSNEMPSHTHSVSGTSAAGGDHSHSGTTGSEASHTHGAGSYAVGSHSHTSGTLVTDTVGNHQHTMGSQNAVNTAATGSSSRVTNLTDTGGPSGNTVTASGAHSHDVTGTSAAATPGFSGSSAAGSSHSHSISASGTHTHTFSVTSGSAGTGATHNNLQPYVGLNYIIKAQ